MRSMASMLNVQERSKIDSVSLLTKSLSVYRRVLDLTYESHVGLEDELSSQLNDVLVG